jgi:transposase
MKLYGGIDLHSNNSVVALIDEEERLVYRKRLPNDAAVVLAVLEPYREALEGLVVESTYNWYWLVDALQEAGYVVHLANPAAMVQYSGLKYTDDDTDARWLARLLRLGLVPEAYIYPKQERAVRDLLRKRSQLVHDHTRHLLSVQSLLARNLGRTLSANAIKQLKLEEVAELLPDPNLALAVQSNLRIMHSLSWSIDQLEREVCAQVRLRPDYQCLLSVSGIGRVLGLTIMLETGDIGRFAGVGNYASYCRCVGSERRSNGKRKGAATARTATSIWPGPMWRRPTSRCATTRRSPATSSASARRPTASSPSRPWPTSWRGPVTTCCATARPLTCSAPSDEVSGGGGELESGLAPSPQV